MKSVAQKRSDWISQYWNEDEYPPQPVYHAGNGGEQIDEKADGLSEPPGCDLGEKDRNTQGEWRCNQQGNRRRHERSVYGGSCPKFSCTHIPLAFSDERKAEL